MRHSRSPAAPAAALLVAIGLLVGLATGPVLAADAGDRWRHAWPNTDFSKRNVDLTEIFSGGPPRDGIPPIDDPAFEPANQMTDAPRATEPVISIVVGGEARAYPLRVLTWHEIVNDEIAGVPVAVTYCPLCNAAIVFDRRVDGKVLDFGTTGNLRRSDLVMYDRQTESWWQQFIGEGIVGEMTGTSLKMLPARLEAFERFTARYPDAKVLVPNNPTMRPYGINPYVGYDSSAYPFLYNGEMPEGIAPLAYVVAVGDTAWSLDLLREKGRIEEDGVVLTWEPGQNSALDNRAIAAGRDVGNVVVQKVSGDSAEDIVHDVTFAFVFHAFRPDGRLIK